MFPYKIRNRQMTFRQGLCRHITDYDTKMIRPIDDGSILTVTLTCTPLLTCRSSEHQKYALYQLPSQSSPGITVRDRKREREVMSQARTHRWWIVERQRQRERLCPEIGLIHEIMSSNPIRLTTFDLAGIADIAYITISFPYCQTNFIQSLS